jgi:hypothetical protein
MLDAQQWVVDTLKARALPHDVNSFLDLVSNRELRTFEIQENTYWDYKDSFPHSMTDDYFIGVCRLVCGFHNRYGGIIIFGIHDKHRTPGHNKVIVDIERFNTRLREVLSAPIECMHRRYQFRTGKPIPANRHVDDAFDFVLVPKRNFSIPVTRFVTSIGKYQPSDIFIRQNHEVLRAKSADIPELYTPRSGFGLLQQSSSAPVFEALPQRPSVLRQFIGRARVLDQIFSWFVTRDEARAFLHGRGGSGKSTIAYEFASIIARHGGDIEIEGGGKIDRVLFLSAKEQELDTKTGKIRKFIGTDFSNADDLFRSILLLCEWSSSERIQVLSDGDVRKELRELFDLQSLLIVIDDIDTLYTTKKIDDGSEFLIAALARAKSRSKILYTMRQMPSIAVSAAIEVPGLENGEYDEFVASCCAQFSVQPPRAEVLMGRLRQVSEGIPLIIETVIGLRKSCGSYDDAITEFLAFGGGDVRKYLFAREYSALGTNHRAKLLLAALALFERPVATEELEYALQFGKSVIHDSIGAISEMFLKPVAQDDGTTKFTIGEVTRQFILEESTKLDRFELLKSRIANYQKPASGKTRKLILLSEKIERLLARGYYPQAVSEIEKNQDPEIIEHPDFKVLAARLYSNVRVGRLDDARKQFADLFAMKIVNVKLYTDWVVMERRASDSLHRVRELCNKIIAAEWMKERDKLYFYFSRAIAQYNRGREMLSLDSKDSFACFVDAMNDHLLVSDRIKRAGRELFERSDEYCANTMHNLLLAARRLGLEKDVVRYVERLCGQKDGFCVDPISIPLMEYIRSIPDRGQKNDLDRSYVYLSRLDAAIQKGRSSFRDPLLAENTRSTIADKTQRVAKALRKEVHS